MMKSSYKFACISVLLGLLTACQQPASNGPVAGKVGKPYAVNGTTYTPQYDPGYDKIGEASWYGPGFHGKRTANGEKFNQNDLTAAHPTLPMPSLVRVTNLANGKSLVVRVNDRGPFKSNRIIDLSKKSAQELGITATQQVRVQFLKEETEQYVARAQEAGKTLSMAEFNAAQSKADEIAVARADARDEPAAARPRGQIVEATDASTHAGQIVSDAAPVMTVSSAEEETPADAPKAGSFIASNDLPAPGDKPQPKRQGIFKEAWADDNVTLPEPPSQAKEEGNQYKAGEKQAPEPPFVNAQGKAAPAAQEATEEKTETPAPKVAEKKELSPSASGKYVITAGAFSSKENAHKLDSKLAPYGKVAIDNVSAAGKQWWRVRVGPFGDKTEAEDALAKIHAAGVKEARLVRQ